MVLVFEDGQEYEDKNGNGMINITNPILLGRSIEGDLEGEFQNIRFLTNSYFNQEKVCHDCFKK